MRASRRRQPRVLEVERRLCIEVRIEIQHLEAELGRAYAQLARQVRRCALVPSNR
jgi:hypothetical protein